MAEPIALHQAVNPAQDEQHRLLVCQKMGARIASISYQIVTEKHGVELECLSSATTGTEFVIQIPIKQQVQSAL